MDSGDIAFGFGLLSHLDGGNASLSPFSIRTALSMVYEGAEGQTAEEIVQVAKFSKGARRQVELQKVLLALNAHHEGFTLATANGLWADQAFPVLDSYTRLLTEAYAAEATSADFKHSAEAWRGNINDWVSGKTEQKIPELFKEGTITDETVIALANALYFKGSWKKKFNPEHTRPQDFTLEDRTVVQVEMMRKGQVEGREPSFSYGYFDGVKAVLLPYKGDAVILPYTGDAVSKLMLLPPKRSSVASLETELREHPETLATWRSHMGYETFSRLELPKHEVRGSYELLAPLRAMGISQVFTEYAELHGISREAIYITSGQHESYFKTDEEGSEGAAATGFGGMRATFAAQPPPAVEFVADRPFLELVLLGDTVLFLNRIMDPR